MCTLHECAQSRVTPHECSHTRVAHYTQKRRRESRTARVLTKKGRTPYTYSQKRIIHHTSAWRRGSYTTHELHARSHTLHKCSQTRVTHYMYLQTKVTHHIRAHEWGPHRHWTQTLSHCVAANRQFTHYMMVYCLLRALRHYEHAQIPLSHGNERDWCLSRALATFFVTIQKETGGIKEKAGGRIGYSSVGIVCSAKRTASIFILCSSRNHFIIVFKFRCS